MYRTSADRYAMKAANRHMIARKRRRRMNQILSRFCGDLRDYAEDWFSGWWMA